MQSSWAVHWFRRDLHIRGNLALLNAAKRHSGRVVGVFAFDPAFLSRPDFSPRRFAFFLATLRHLRSELRESGSDLLVLDRGPDTAFTTLLSRVSAPPAEWCFARDYEPFARERDERIRKLLSHTYQIPCLTERDHLLIEPSELLKDDGTFYKVYTPFSKRWLKMLASGEIRQRIVAQTEALRARPRFNLRWKEVIRTAGPKRADLESLEGLEDQLDLYLERYPFPPDSIQPGLDAALGLAREFGSERLDAYAHARDIPATPGTSKLGIYFKNGSITVPQVIAELELPGKHGEKFLNELIWREFYTHVLWHIPTAETLEIQSKYRAIPWENRLDLFEAWQQGRTGFPLVDAAMRELAATGWMHNRMRMVVASFLTKDLHIDWRWGERHFMRELLDGDLAPNNGGWQWAASTGCDAQPYFRIFNPERQSRRFDPQGEYIRRWVPELRGLSDQEIHAPWAKGAGPRDYPRPIVDHSARAKAAIAMYKRAPDVTQGGTKSCRPPIDRERTRK